jgi:hypothetical protein
MEFSRLYPALHYYIENYGNIEIGEDEKTGSLLRIVDEEGILYNDVASPTINDAVAEAEAFLKDYLFENLGIKIVQ